MAVYTTITQTEAQQLFKPLGEIKKFEGIREGVENTNYLVHLNDSKKYILTIFEKRTNEKDLPYFNKLMKLFHSNGVSCPLSVTIKNEDLFRIRLQKSYDFNKALVENVFKEKFEHTYEEICEEFLGYGSIIKQYVANITEVLSSAVEKDEQIMFEGAQGACLDVDHGLYPYTTSSNTIAGQVEAGSGVGLNAAKKIVGIAKAYLTYVGRGPFPTEIKGDLEEKIRDVGKEYGTTTGRARRVGWFDLVQLKFANQLNDFSEIILTKVDVLSGIEDIKLCVGYKVDGKDFKGVPSDIYNFKNITPIYETLSGWASLPDIIESLDQCPEELKNFVSRVEEVAKVKISLISYGPDRNQTFKV